ncbi:hypothetical protein ACJJTC_013487 [Scirpophaga incertulas]
MANHCGGLSCLIHAVVAKGALPYERTGVLVVVVVAQGKSGPRGSMVYWDYFFLILIPSDPEGWSPLAPSLRSAGKAVSGVAEYMHLYEPPQKLEVRKALPSNQRSPS